MRHLADGLTVAEIEAQLQEALDKEGLVLVPREPTEAMIDAALASTAARLITVNREKVRIRYKAMLRAYENTGD